MAFPLYIDDDSGDVDLVRGGLNRQWDLIRATDVGMRGADDPDHLAYATRAGRTLLTANMSDFEPLHWEWMAAGRHHAGIVLVRQQQWSVGEILRRLERLLVARTADEMIDCIEWLSRWGEDAGR